MADRARGTYLCESLVKTNQETYAIRIVPGVDDVLDINYHRRNFVTAISFFVRRVDVSADRDMKKVWIMVAAQYACFLSGLFCFALNLMLIWATSE